MKIRAEKGDIEKVQCDLLIVGMFDSESNRFTTKLDERLKTIRERIKNAAPTLWSHASTWPRAMRNAPTAITRIASSKTGC